MKLDQLRYFLETARFQHVGRAGKALHISPSAISFAITSLEEELQSRLFNRVGNRIVLSEAGQHLKVRVEALFDSVDQIRSEFIKTQSGVFHGDFKIGGSHFLANHFLNRAWNQFQSLNPSLIGEVSPSRTSDVVKSVIAGTLDLGLCFSPLRHPDLVIEHLYLGQLFPVVRKGHPVLKFSKNRKSTLSALSKYPAILHKPSAGADFCEDHPEFLKRGIQCRVENYFESDDLAVETIISTQVWSLIPDLVTKQYRDKISQLPVPKDWKAPYSVSLVFRQTRRDSPIIQAFSKLMKRAFHSKD